MKEATYECNDDSASRNASHVEASLSWHRRNGVPHYCRVFDLHHFRGRLPVLRREESFWADAARSARNADLRHDLFVVQQLNGSFRRQILAFESAQRISRSVVSDHPFGRDISPWHRQRVAPPDLRARSDDFNESFRNDLLLARRFARHTRRRGPDYADHSVSVRRRRPGRSRAVGPSRSAGFVLAFRGRRVGGRFLCGLSDRSVRGRDDSAAIRRTEWNATRARTTCADRLADCFGVWLYVVVRWFADEHLGQRAWSSARAHWLCWLVPAGLPARAGRNRSGRS